MVCDDNQLRSVPIARDSRGPSCVNARRARARRRSRGAVFVEGIVVASTLALLLTCAVFFHRLYNSKLSTMIEAREQAWAQSLPGCGGGMVMGLLDTVGLGALSALREADSAGIIDSPDWISDAGRGVGSPQRNVVAGPMLGGANFDIRTRTSVACNERGGQAEEDSIIGALFAQIRDLVDFQ